jgi:hypothetical protein
MNRAEAIERCRQEPSVKMNVAVAALGISRKTADKRRKIDGHIADDVKVITVTERTLLVPSAAVLRALQLEGSPLGLHTRLTQGGTTEEAPRLGASSVTAQMPRPSH